MIQKKKVLKTPLPVTKFFHPKTHILGIFYFRELNRYRPTDFRFVLSSSDTPRNMLRMAAKPKKKVNSNSKRRRRNYDLEIMMPPTKSAKMHLLDSPARVILDSFKKMKGYFGSFEKISGEKP